MKPVYDYDVFLSFSSQDMEPVRVIWQQLCLSGLRVFWSDETLKTKAGEQWLDMIQHALISSQHLLLVCSKASMESFWVKQEYSTFLNKCHAKSPEHRLLVTYPINQYPLEQLPAFLQNVQSAASIQQIIERLGGSDLLRLKEENQCLKEQLNTIQTQLDLAHNALKHHNISLPHSSIVKDIHAPGFIFADQFSVTGQSVTGPKMITLAQGHYTMGNSHEPGDRNEYPAHNVRIGQPFAVSLTPITFDDYDLYCRLNDKPPVADEQWGRGQRPVIHVSFFDALAYVLWLREQTGHGYRLLSESEWEYACRANTDSAYYWGEQFQENQAANNGHSTEPCAGYAANSFGLYDMVGNVWEWVEDHYHDHYQGAPDDQRAWLNYYDNASPRVLRGGCWLQVDQDLRCCVRYASDPNKRSRGVGFRIARDIDTPS